MSTGTSSLRRTKRRGAALVAACAAALAAALAGPAWAGSVPTPDDPPAGPRGLASPQIAEAPTKASSPEARATRGRRNRGVDSDARRTPGGADDARDAKGGCTHGRRQDEQGHDAGADEHRDPAARADVRLHGHRAHREARACRRLCATARDCAEAEAASRATGERNEAKASPAPAIVAVPRDGNRLGLPIGTLTLSSVASDGGRTRNARSRGAPARGRGRGRPRRGRRRPPSRSDRVSPMRILGLALVAVRRRRSSRPNVGSAASTPVAGMQRRWMRRLVQVERDRQLVIRPRRASPRPGLRSDDDHGRHSRHDAVTCTVYTGPSVLREQRHRREGLEPAVGRTVLRPVARTRTAGTRAPSECRSPATAARRGSAPAPRGRTAGRTAATRR